MTRVGYALSSEEHGPDTLVETGVNAERAGFDFALVSDHFHPWTTTQGNAPFVWSVLAGLARETEDLRVGTGVTCPTVRIHPAILAQATATTAAMFGDDRFFFGIGTGEYLNEHVLGDHWPPTRVRLEMMEEAVEVIRKLWTGENVTHYGDHYTVENARLFTLPDENPDVHASALGPKAAEHVSEYADGLVNTSPDEEVCEIFQEDGDGPHYGQATICYAESEEEARETAYEWWPNTAVPGELGQLLPTPEHFEQATELVEADDVAEKVPHGPDPETYIDTIEEYVDAGYDRVYVHQVGPDQEACIDFFENEVLPSF